MNTRPLASELVPAAATEGLLVRGEVLDPYSLHARAAEVARRQGRLRPVRRTRVSTARSVSTSPSAPASRH